MAVHLDNSMCSTNGFVSLDHLAPGTHELWVEYAPEDDGPPIRSQSFVVVVAPDAELDSAAGNAKFRLGVSDPSRFFNDGSCQVTTATTGVAGLPGMPVSGPPVETPLGLVRFELSDCIWGNGFSAPGPPVIQRITLESSVPLPPNTSVWVFGPDLDDAAQKWREVPAMIEGDRATFEVGNNLAPVVAFGVSTREVGNYQGAWWVDSPASGWGVSLFQDGTRLHGVLFMYDSAGNPRWLLMPSGKWDSRKRIHTAAAFRPVGPPMAGYDAAAYHEERSVGTVSLEFTAADTATLRIAVDGKNVEKRVK
jgi:hypothetical protein